LFVVARTALRMSTFDLVYRKQGYL